MNTLRRYWLMFVSAILLAGCGADTATPSVQIIEPQALMLSVNGGGELRSSKSTPLNVPGSNWDSRKLQWMLPEGSRVKKGDLLARFTTPEGQQALDQATIELQRNALARAAKTGELESAQGRVDVDLSEVATQLAIAQRYASADLSTLARNDVLDAVQDARYLGERQETLHWLRGQSQQRGAAELGVLDARRATFDVSAKARQADLDALELRAPADGVVLLAKNWSGDKPAVGTSMYAGTEYGSLPDLDAMEIEIVLPQLEAQGVRVGNAVELFPVGHPEQRFTARLSWIASAAKARSRQDPVKYLSMRAPVPAEQVRRLGLVPGQQLQARVTLVQAQSAIAVANVAIGNDDGKSFVRVREGNRFVRHDVVLGARGPARSQVLSGLHAGDEVLLVDNARKPDMGDATAVRNPGSPPAIGAHAAVSR